MAGDYSALQVLVTAQTRDMAAQIASAATDAGNQASKSLSSTITSGLGSAAKAVGNAISTGFTVAAGATAAFGGAVLASGKSYNVLMQTSNAAFKTILGSADAANKMMSDLSAFASKSPFPRQAFIEATQQMLAFGIQTQKVIPYLGAVQDAVAAAGGSATDLSQITTIMSQISSAGKITGTDLMQFGQHGINAADLIGKAMGKTGAQIKDEITAGTLDANDALDALAAGMEATYGGAADLVKQTWSGATDRIKGAMRDIGSAIMEPFISKGGGGLALEWANKFADLLRAVEPLITPIVNLLVDKLQPAFAHISGWLDSAINAVKGFGGEGAGAISGLVSSIGGLAPVLAPIAGMLLKVGGANLAGAFGPLGPMIETLTGALGPFGSALVAIVATSPAV